MTTFDDVLRHACTHRKAANALVQLAKDLK